MIKIASIDAIRHDTAGANYNARIVVVYRGGDDTIFSIFDVLKALEPFDESFASVRAKSDDFYAYLIDLVKDSLLAYFDKIMRQDTLDYGKILNGSRNPVIAEKWISEPSVRIILSKDLMTFTCKRIAPILKETIANFD
ncbi:MAG TPA: hypothetical protein VK452_10505 [Dissulfurispiraceae bacterium]|nr:hypothetical protein [Dissulfurispiraceae bacterium]